MMGSEVPTWQPSIDRKEGFTIYGLEGTDADIPDMTRHIREDLGGDLRENWLQSPGTRVLILDGCTYRTFVDVYEQDNFFNEDHEEVALDKLFDIICKVESGAKVIKRSKDKSRYPVGSSFICG